MSVRVGYRNGGRARVHQEGLDHELQNEIKKESTPQSKEVEGKPDLGNKTSLSYDRTHLDSSEHV